MELMMETYKRGLAEATGWLALPGVLPMALVMAVCGVGSLLALGLALHGGNR
ncbi:hypothetical protein HKT39_21135 [Pseudomonas aeruginosa]|nr:hypothetical protein [Pseudomonas aeruginosa]